MPSPKDRQNSGISMAEKEPAQKLLSESVDFINGSEAEAANEWIEQAMKILGMGRHV